MTTASGIAGLNYTQALRAELVSLSSLKCQIATIQIENIRNVSNHNDFKQNVWQCSIMPTMKPSVFTTWDVSYAYLVHHEQLFTYILLLMYFSEK